MITPIGLDHAEYLGTDVLGIAREKSGIIKPGAVAVIAAQDKAVAQVLLERCVEVGAQVARQGAEFGVRVARDRVGGQRLVLRGPVRHRTTRSSCRCTASTRRATPRSRWPRWRR